MKNKPIQRSKKPKYWQMKIMSDSGVGSIIMRCAAQSKKAAAEVMLDSFLSTWKADEPEVDKDAYIESADHLINHTKDECPQCKTPWWIASKCWRCGYREKGGE